jgi:putative AlgH/UPF0301 family transcriptional regulator
MHLGGWEAARPRVADSSLAASRFKFYLGGTAWGPGQLDDEIKAGAWIQVRKNGKTWGAEGGHTGAVG